MELPIFYASPEHLADDVVLLPAAESHHAVDVLRMQAGSLAIVVDGLGNGARGEIRVTKKKQVELVVHSRVRQFGEPSIKVTLAAGLSVGYKFDEIVDKGTQLGVSRFVPLMTEKSKIKLDDPKRLRAKTDRLEKVALAAMKQCRRSYRPEIALPLSFRQFMSESDEGLKLIFHPSSDCPFVTDLTIAETPQRITLLVGPESGFSSTEVAAARDKGYLQVGLGKRILRTENAGPIAVALVMAKFDEFN